LRSKSDGNLFSSLPSSRVTRKERKSLFDVSRVLCLLFLRAFLEVYVEQSRRSQRRIYGKGKEIKALFILSPMFCCLIYELRSGYMCPTAFHISNGSLFMFLFRLLRSLPSSCVEWGSVQKRDGNARRFFTAAQLSCIAMTNKHSNFMILFAFIFVYGQF
jgi:hypothetical protein